MKILLNTFIFMTLASCGNYSELKDEGFLDFSGLDRFKDQAITFERVKAEIFKPHCISCHKGYEDYENVVSDISAIENSINIGRMPKNAPALGSEERLLLRAWITQGMLNGTGPVKPLPPAPIEEFSFENVSKRILVPKCLICHSEAGQASFLDLTTRQKIFDLRDEDFFGEKFLDFNAPEKSYLIKIIEDEEEPMPPVWSGLKRLTKEDVDLLKGWIQRGLP